MFRFYILTPLLLLAVFAGVRAQQANPPKTEGQTIKERIGKPTNLKPAPKAPEASISSRNALRQQLFPGANGAGSGVQRTAGSGARKANVSAKSAAELPSNTSSSDAAKQIKLPATSNPVDLKAQGTEPPPPTPTPTPTTTTKAKETTPKN